MKQDLRFKFRSELPRDSLSFPSFNIRFGRNEGGGFQAAVVVSKKVDKRATIRNRIKRQVLELIRKNLDETLPVTLVFYIKKEALNTDGLAGEIELALKKIKNV